ncbi:phage tail tape measure protein [Pseudomonas sp. SP16.1]|uniref:phage tail tape measure protein n=1 Tax=Pseudomonas sp. SP16.1 TaxID=3458854 RepID=UPI0040465A18
MDIASLGFSIDTSDVAKAETALDRLNTAGAKTEESARGVSNAMSGIAGEASTLSSAADSSAQALNRFVSSEQSAAKVGEQFVSALREQVDLFGKSADDILRYQAAQLGVQQQSEGLIVQLRGLKDAQEAANQAFLQESIVMSAAAQSREAVSASRYALIEGLREQVALFGKSSLEIAEFEARMLGVADSAAPLIANLRELQSAQRQAEEAAKAEADAQRAAEAARQSAASQQEAFLGGLREQVALFGRSSDEVAQYRANLLGVSDSAAPLIAQIKQLSAAQREAERTAREEAEAQRQAAIAKQQATAQQDSFLASLREQVALQGKSRDEVLAYRAGQLGVGNEAEQYIAQIRAFNLEQEKTGTVFDKNGLSARQYQASLRQLPAQFTDIVVSLQAGQNPFTVFLQQGAQIKDSFGGAGAALAEVARYALGLVNPFTVAAVAVGALALAYKQGSDEGTAFNNALILSGNIAGTSAERLANAAAAIDQVTGTQRQAARALAEVAGTGKFTADQIETIGLAAVAMEEATGRAISETVNEFKRLADEPTAAAAKLNEQYNFLTAAVYDQISALEQQGDAAGAAQLAIDTFAQSMNERANEIEQGLGFIERAWKGIKDGAAEAWDEMLGVGRSQTPEERLEELTSGSRFNFGRIAANAAVLGPIGGAKELFDQFTRTGAEQNEQIAEIWQEIQDRDEKAWVEGMQAQQEQSAIEAQQRIDQLRKSTLTNAEKRVKALNDLRADLAKIELVNPDDPRLAADNVARLERNIAEQFRDRQSTTRTPAVRDDAATRMLLTLRQQSAELETQLLSETKLTAEQKKRAEFESLIADLKTKDILTADQKSLLANQDAIKAQLDKNVALGEEVRLHNDSIKLQERSAQLQETIRASLEGRQEQQQRQLDAFGLGRRELERVQAEASIFREFRRYQAQLDKATPADLLGSAQYETAVQEIKGGLNEALAANEDYFERLDELQADWKNGAKGALADYIADAKDIAGQTYDLFNNALGGLEDAFVEFALTGKLSFKDLANSIIADLARIAARQLTANLAEGLLGSLGGASGGLSSLFGASSGSYTGAFGFDGGGYTGNAPRTGGIDGKGGFLAIMHPQETVIDHTKPSANGRMGGGNTQNNYFSFPNITDAKQAREATATAARQFNAIAQQSARFG